MQGRGWCWDFDGGLGWRELDGGTWMEGRGWRDFEGGTSREGPGWRHLDGGTLMEGLGWRDLDAGRWMEGTGWRDFDGGSWMEGVGCRDFSTMLCQHAKRKVSNSPRMENQCMSYLKRIQCHPSLFSGTRTHILVWFL